MTPMHLLRILAILSHLSMQVVPVSAGVSAETVLVYPHPEGLPSSADVQVQVDGEDVFVHDAGFAAFAAFSVEEAATVEVTSRSERGIESWRLKPHSYEIPVEREGRTLTFPLAVHQTVDLEINGTDRPLLIFANPMPGPPPAGEGVRVFEAGRVHDAGDIHLEDGQTLWFEPGAVVRGSIEARNKRGVSVRGFGLLDARRRERAVRFFHTDDVVFDGPTVLSDGNWCLAMFESNRVELRNFRLINPAEIYCDGVDILGCHDVTLDRFFILSGDDAISIKTTKFGYSAPSKDILIENGVVWNRHAGNGLEIGYENSLDVTGVTFRNIDILRNGSQEQTFRRAAISIHQSHAGHVRRIRYEEIRIEDATENTFWIGTLRFKDSPEALGSISDVSFENVDVSDPSVMKGVIRGESAESPVRGVSFRGLRRNGQTLTSFTEAGIEVHPHANTVSIAP